MKSFPVACALVFALVGCAEKKAPAPAAAPAPTATAAPSKPDRAPSLAPGPLAKRPRPFANDDGLPQRGWQELTDEQRAARRAERDTRRAERQADMLATYDADQDGALSDAERQAMRESRVADMIGRLDVDQDGKLSVAEFDGDGRRRGPPIEQVDADADGFITAAELLSARPPRGDRGPGGARGPRGADAPAPPAR